MNISNLKKALKALVHPGHRLSDFKAAGIGITLPSGGVIDHKEQIALADYIYIGPDPYIFGRGGLHIGRNVVIGPKVTIHTTNHNYESAKYLPYDDTTYCRPVVIERNVWIGSHALICPGVTIAEGSVVAMGAVVTKNFPRGSIIGGNPAIVIKTRDMDEYRRLDESGKHFLKFKFEGKTSPTYLDPSP